jgi:hypothetical protein
VGVGRPGRGRAEGALRSREPCVNSSYMHGMNFTKFIVNLLRWIPGASAAVFFL